MCALQASYRYIQKNENIVNNNSISSENVEKKYCGYRFLEQNNEEIIQYQINCYNHYQEYVSYHRKLGVKNESNEMNDSEKSQNPELELSGEENEQNKISDSDKEQEDVLNFLEKKKLNVYKNILYAFNKHIQNCNNDQQKDLYQQFTDNEWSYDHIKMRTSQNLKNTGRSSLKVRNLLKSKKLSKIFIHFLENANELWLINSKISDKDNYLSSIQLLLKGIQSNILVDNIQYYKKKLK